MYLTKENTDMFYKVIIKNCPYEGKIALQSRNQFQYASTVPKVCKY